MREYVSLTPYTLHLSPFPPGVTGFDRKFNAPVVRNGSERLPKNVQTLSANKVARAVLSPIQMADLESNYAFA